MNAQRKRYYIMKTFTYENLTVTVERKGHDANGNPLYMVKPVNFEFVHCNKATRNYISKGYYLIMSYEINDDIPWFLEKLYNQTRDAWKVNFPAGDDMNYHLVNDITGQHLLVDIGDIDSMDELSNIDILLQLKWKEV